ncbi:securin KNAG_0H03230 [Huiozyma naganishii CBS 8797]|uniref:Uncharacterized protein n=1 Tax=Huiozyma naganishii (strain ATCC MYA-139 / BCRC 22969 / CBS 8797 / KCTC 17520 / NBRC 10181 / NCYC 3082 / Yp74L-3) TaxID=1071383 RepID=J7RPS1_HUIN7|nr:hypothetical protein KNAG_0H03230 [Kazachstania naganishii CBS 8797]CCK71738.1 hypothetical protein KNAG_0H03230 [Kazachstania naganishii CBS 8797]
MQDNEDKENAVAVPQTPASNILDGSGVVLKPVGSRGKQSFSVRKSPTRGGRLPLASKDNNASGLVVSGKLGRQPADQVREANSSRKLKRYGSLLGYDNRQLTRSKSLILKDPEAPNESSKSVTKRLLLDEEIAKNSSDGDDDGDDTDILKIRSQLGGGLDRLVRQSQNRELEIRPQAQDELPYIPDGHIILHEADIAKLRDYAPRDIMIDDSGADDTDDDKRQADGSSLQLLELEDIPDGPEHTQPEVHLNTLDRFPQIAGSEDWENGLTNDDIEDLINGI